MVFSGDEVFLGGHKPIEDAIKLWRDAMRGEQVSRERELAERVHALVWKPLLDQLGDANMVLISPEGVLARIPFSALPGFQANQFLLEVRSIVIMPVPNLLLSIQRRRSTTPTKSQAANTKPRMLLIGDVDCDLQQSLHPAATMASATNSPPLPIRRGNESAFPNLPGTAQEVTPSSLCYLSSLRSQHP